MDRARRDLERTLLVGAISRTAPVRCYTREVRVLVLLSVMAAAWLCGTVAHAEPTCPSRDEVATHLLDDTARAADFRIVDEGETFSVTLREERRVFNDPSRDCTARAKLAAVAVTAMVAPPSASLSGPPALGALGGPLPETPKPPPSLPPPPAPAPAPGSPPAFRFAVGSGIDWSPGLASHDAVVAFGVLLRGLWFPGAGRYALGLGAAAFLPASFQAGPAEVRITRAVLDLGFHYSAPLGDAIRITPGLGPALEIHDVRGTAANGAGDLRAFFALRGSLDLAAFLSRSLGIGVELVGLLLPVTGDLALHRGGVVGKEPSLYLGLDLGLRFQL
jgi:hypothetical protein